MAGLTTTGLQTLRYQEIFDNIKSRLLRDISPNLDVSEDSQLGLFLASIARSLADTHEILSEIYDGGTIDKAEGFNLDDITALNAVYRYVAQATRGQVEFTGTTGATIPSTTRLTVTSVFPVWSTRWQEPMRRKPSPTWRRCWLTMRRTCPKDWVSTSRRVPTTSCSLLSTR